MAGGAVVLIAALLIIIGTFTPWASSSGPYGYVSVSTSGWDTVDYMENKVFDWNDGKPVFSGLCSLIAGCLLALLAILAMASRNKGLAGLAFFFAILALIMAATNTYSILSAGTGTTIGFGMILFLIGAAGSLAGGIMGMSG